MAFTTYDNAPYLYRRSGGGGDKEIDKLVGGTIAWNQLVENGNFADTSNWSWFPRMTVTVSGNVATVTTPERWNSILQTFDWTYGHVMLATASVKKVGESGDVFVKVTNDFAYMNQQFAKAISTNDVWTDVVMCGKYTATPEGSTSQIRIGVQEYRPSNSNNGFQVKNVMVHDLTLMFGSTIADYVYSLEQSSQGSGLAWLRSYGFFTEDYYDYNSGELKSVSNLVSHDMTGKNLLNLNATSKTQNGITFTVNTDGSIKINGTATSGDAYLTKTTGAPSKMTKGTTVTLSGVVGSTTSRLYLQLIYIGADGNTISISSVSGATTYTFTQDATFSAYWLTVRQGATHDNTMVYPQLEFGSTATSYEPYTLHSYPLGDVTLRGLPKLNGNALYYDGDTYESNGTVTRKYGVVDLGSLNWGYRAADSSKPYPQEYATLSGAVSGVSTNVVCPKYSASQEPVLGRTVDKTICTFNGAVYVSDSSYSTATEFKTAMSGVYLVYELASSTTETADTYTNPQWVDPNGTEKYTLSTNAFPMPVGHETTYNTDIGSKTVNTQVNLSMTEPSVRQIYAKEGDTARVLNIHLDQTEEDGTLRILRPDGTEVTADAVLVPDFYDGLMAEIPSDATEIVGKCYCDVEQNGVSSMPFTLNVKKNERES